MRHKTGLFALCSAVVRPRAKDPSKNVNSTRRDSQKAIVARLTSPKYEDSKTQICRTSVFSFQAVFPETFFSARMQRTKAVRANYVRKKRTSTAWNTFSKILRSSLVQNSVHVKINTLPRW